MVVEGRRKNRRVVDTKERERQAKTSYKFSQKKLLETTKTLADRQTVPQECP